MLNINPKTIDTGKIVIGLAFALGLVNYLDRVVISYAIGPIQKDFGIDNASFGLAMSLFAAGALAINGISGVLLDRYGARRIWSLGLIVWSLTMFLMGWIHYWWLFLAFRVLLGFGEGVNFPAMNRAIADWIPQKKASQATSIALLGVPCALLIGGPILSWLISQFGWRQSFMALGIAGFAIFVVWLLLYREPGNTRARTAPTLAEYGDVLRNPTILATAWSFFGFGAILFFGVTWVPGYFEHKFELNLMTIGWFATMPWAVSIVGMLVIGTLSDHLFRASGDIRRARIHLIWVLQLLAAASFIPLAFITSSDWAVFWLTLGIGFSMSANGPYYSICTDLFPKSAGAATGIIVTFFSAAGVLIPFLVGWLTDSTASFDTAFLMLSGIVGSGALGLLLFARPSPPTQLRQ
ncbi:MAG: MFS transporter [Gammaproteobacteria bacterium]|nr:MFS transporter [Gammaproteobacteria bacterium]